MLKICHKSIIPRFAQSATTNSDKYKIVKLGYNKKNGGFMNHLKKYRKLANLTMMDIVKLTRGEFSQSRLSSYETGARQLTVEAALALAPILKVSAAQLLGISDKDKETQKLGDQQQELFNLLSDISLRGEKDVAQVAAMLRAYLQHQ